MGSNFIPSVHDSIIIIGSGFVTLYIWFAFIYKRWVKDYTFGSHFIYKRWVEVFSFVSCFCYKRWNGVCYEI
jgi:hypothetical protein